MFQRKIDSLDWVIITLFLAFNFILQTQNIDTYVNVRGDEGNYLYSAKLTAQGLIPYKDYFLAHPPFLILLSSLLFKIANFNMLTFHFIYILWVLSSIIPLYFILIKFTNSRLATILSLILYCTFPELARTNIHFFELRPFSLPFLAFSLFFIFVKKQLVVAAIFLSLFSIGILSNLILAILFTLILLINDFINNGRQLLTTFHNYRGFLSVYIILTFVSLGSVFLIQNSFSNIIDFHLTRPNIPLSSRIQYLAIIFIDNWGFFTLSFLSILFVNWKNQFLSIFNILSLIIITTISHSFYSHYLSILSIGFTITTGIGISQIIKSETLRLFIIIIIALSAYQSFYGQLKPYLIDSSSPDFFRIIDILKSAPQPLFTLNPTFALYSGTDITYHYDAADMKHRFILYQDLTENEYRNILPKSGTLLIDPETESKFSLEIQKYIQGNFQLTYQDQYYKIYEK